MTTNSSIDTKWAARFENLLVGGGGEDDEAPRSVGIISDAVEVLTPEEMANADRLAMAAGTPGTRLMEAAGLAVAEAVHDLVPHGGKVAIMTGPGNNGGDGFVAARLLSEAGYDVQVSMLTARDRLNGDAAFAAAAWTGFTKGLGANVADGADIVVDALFGAGLDRPVEGLAAQAVNAVNASDVPVVAVDLPSGIDGRTGRVLGTAIKATLAVTFFRPKPGHLLRPGRSYFGKLIVADIGIAPAVLETIRPKTVWNTPAAWTLPTPSTDGHKYDRGHAVAVSGPPTRTGAARLAARGALRVGAGLVSIASPTEALAVNAAQITAIMLLAMPDAAGLAQILADERRNAVVLGPALGVGDATVALVETALASAAAVVIDADGLTSFAARPERLFKAIAGRQPQVVITPHQGEFAKLFSGFTDRGSKLDRARQAAAQSGAILVLKGPDTVVAAPDGRASIADNAPPDLATAGSGDVLAGMVAGLLAQGMPAFEAASAAVWLHGAAGAAIGRGLIAEDLPEALPAIFAGMAGD